MSKMGNTIFEIQELYFANVLAEDIAKKTNTSLSFVNGVIEELNGPSEPDYYIPEGDYHV